MSALLPLIACLAGTGLLYGSWSGTLANKALASLAGWALITISLFLWIPVAGTEFGGVYAVLVLPLAAWIFIVADPNRGHSERQAAPVRDAARAPAPGRVVRNLLVFFIAVPVAAVASALVALELSSWLPWSDIDRIVTSLLAMPVLWGILSFWVCADEKLLRPAATMLVGGILSGLALYA